MSDLDEYQARVRINRDDLDTELAQQPECFANVSRQWTLAISRRDAASQKVKRIRAKLYLKLRDDLKDEKPSETTLSSHIEIDPEFKEANKVLMEATSECSQWEVLKDSFIQRSYALKDLVNLFVHSYFETGASTVGSRAEKDNADYAASRAKIADARRRPDAPAPKGRPRLNDDV